MYTRFAGLLLGFFIIGFVFEWFYEMAPLIGICGGVVFLCILSSYCVALKRLKGAEAALVFCLMLAMIAGVAFMRADLMVMFYSILKWSIAMILFAVSVIWSMKKNPQFLDDLEQYIGYIAWPIDCLVGYVLSFREVYLDEPEKPWYFVVLFDDPIEEAESLWPRKSTYHILPNRWKH